MALESLIFLTCVNERFTRTWLLPAVNSGPVPNEITYNIATRRVRCMHTQKVIQQPDIDLVCDKFEDVA